MPADRREIRVPADLRIEVGVQIDEAGRHDVALGVDLALALCRDLADFGDPAIGDSDVPVERFCAGSVDDGSTTDHDVMGHGERPSELRLARACPSRSTAQPLFLISLATESGGECASNTRRA